MRFAVTTPTGFVNAKNPPEQMPGIQFVRWQLIKPFSEVPRLLERAERLFWEENMIVVNSLEEVGSMIEGRSRAEVRMLYLQLRMDPTTKYNKKAVGASAEELRDALSEFASLEQMTLAIV